MILALQIFLYFLAAMFFIGGLDAWIVGTSAIHQILKVLDFGFAALMLGSVMISHAMNRNRAALVEVTTARQRWNEENAR